MATGLDDEEADDGPLVETPNTAAERARFHQVDAPALAAAIGITSPRLNKPTEKFAYFEDDKRFVVVAGAQEQHTVAFALARGLGLRGNKRLVLVLPDQHSFATMQRAPWFVPDARPEVWTHGRSGPTKQPHKKRADTVQALVDRLAPGVDVASDLRDATRVKHLGPRSSVVEDLVEWATLDPRLDPAHLKNQRAWHCMGQKLLSITGSKGGLKVTAGVHYTGQRKPAFEASITTLTPGDVQKVKAAVEHGIATRLTSDDKQIHKPDEHWLQAVIRREPKLVGVEQPALREVPAWRPRDDVKKPWGRGFIDLLGIDGHGNIRIVETKLSTSTDELVILQGLDYYVWSCAYKEAIRARLSAARAARFDVHYVIGDDISGAIHVTPHAKAQVEALVDEVTWRFQTVHDWYRGPTDAGRATTALLPPGEVPT